MPQNRSCKKRIRTSQKQNSRNRQTKSAVKTAIKKFQAATGDEAEAAYRTAASELDRAAKKGTIPKPRADRRKSRLALQLNKKSA